MFSGALTNAQKIKITAAPTTASGAPAPIDGGLQGEVLAGGPGTVEQVAGDPNSVYYVSGDGSTALGVVQVRVFGDADLGSGVRLLEDIGELTVGTEEAVSLGVTVGAPEPK